MKIRSAKLLKLISYILILFFGVGLVFFSREISESAIDGMRLCAQTVIPGLFPFFVISSLAVSTGFTYYLGRALETPMRKIFNLPGVFAGALAMGLIGGYPLGAKTIANLYSQKQCTKKEAESALGFCCNCGPAFIFGVAGATVFNDMAIGLVLYLIHIASALLSGVILCRRRRNEHSLAIISQSQFCPVPLGKAFVLAVSGSAASMLNVCAFVIFFGVAIKFLTIILPLPPEASAVIFGLLEMTNGVCSAQIAGASTAIKMILVSLFIAFGGFSVHCQTLSFTCEQGLSAKKYFLGKSLHGLFAAVLTASFIIILQLALQF